MNQNNDVTKDTQRLNQTETLERLCRSIPLTEMVTVYWSDRSSIHSHGIYCALIPSSQIQDRLDTTSWDLSHGHGYPGTCIHHKDGKDITAYYRFGDNSGIEPLIIDREFYGTHPYYLEINEEFRLFHQLYYDPKEDNYIKIDDSGSEQIVAIVKPNRVEIRLKEIRQFLAIKEMHLSIQFDYREHSQHSLETLGLTPGGENHQKELYCWGLHYGNGDSICRFNSFSRLLGKRLIPPLPKEKSGMWGFTKKEKPQYVDFIIGIDDDGDKLIHTSNPDELADYFGANPEAPHYLTPVHFRKAILDKYYQQTSKFSVEDSYLRCGSLWGMQMDNHHPDKVCAWLGDLGRDLPYDEQLHWRSQNIADVGNVSETYFKRQVLAQFTDSDRPEHNFVSLYSNFQRRSQEVLGWPLLLPLAREDEHHLRSIRIPSTNEQKDFDDLILALTKILVDSLNEKQLNRLIPKEEVGTIKGSISRLERVLEIREVDGYKEQIDFLRNLQNLRSAGTAHRKGKNYLKIATAFNIHSTSLVSVFEGILIKSNGYLQFLGENFCHDS
ncbi:MAG: hypothetical protein MI702_14885 [Chlorobiales bacterium]|nr:hypothetical protein [Chlorobiales bacterium]